MTPDPTTDDTPTMKIEETAPDDNDTSREVTADDRVPLAEINEQTDVMLTSFFDAANSMGTWHRKLEDVDVPIPKTHMIDLEGGTQAYLGMPKSEITPLFMSEDPDMKMDFIGRPDIGVDGIQDLIETDFEGNDVFVRSYHKSARHLDDLAGQIIDPTIENIRRTIAALFDDHIIQKMPTGDGIAIREFLDLDFMPDGSRTFHPEVRFFIDDGDVQYHWPRMHKESFEKETGDLEFYDKQVQHIEDNIDDLRTYAKRVAEAFTPYSWSVDFVMDTDGNWYCTDMAVNALYWNEENQMWNNMSEHESGSEYNLEETVGTELPPPASPPEGFPAWRNPELERNAQ